MTQTATAAFPRTDLRAAALALAADGHYPEAIRMATLHLREGADEELERLLVAWRISAFLGKPQPAADPNWPRAYADPFPGVVGVPEIPAAQLNTDILAGAILHHGALLVRGLVSPDDAAKLAAGIDHALDGFSAWADDKSLPGSPWFTPATLTGVGKLAHNRPWILAGGGCWAADSPRMLFELAELLEHSGVLAAVTGYLAERPALSVGKTTLRKVPVALNNTDWHQDGAFLGKTVRSVNLWLALSPCGRDASALDVLPKRLEDIVQTGTDGAIFAWSVGHGMVESLATDAPIASPEFSAGDALLFDHMFLHRTSLPPNRSKDRWAIESWMFAPSCYPVDQGPLML